MLELGAGCGLTGLVAGKKLLQSTQDSSVILTDFNAKVVNNVTSNIRLNDLQTNCRAVGLDFYQQTGTSTNGWIDMQGQHHPPVNVILAADMICQASDAVAAAKAMQDVLLPGGKAYVMSADAKHRFGVDQLEACCRKEGLHVVESIKIVPDTENVQLQTNLVLTAGYVPEMSFRRLVIEKPASSIA